MDRSLNGALCAPTSDPDALEAGFRLASAASNHCLWEWDLLSGEVSRSDAMASQFGYAPKDICANTDWWRDRIHPNDRGRACKSIDGAIARAADRNWTCEYRFRRRDGSYAHVFDRASILRDESDRAIRAFGAVMDLSEIHDAYKVVKEREQRYRYTIELTGQIAWSTSADGKVAEFGERWSALTGLPQVVTQAEWAQAAHPDDFPKAIEQWERSVSSGQPLDFEHRLKMLDGEYRWFRGRAAAHRNPAGEVERWYGTIEDIEELKASQIALTRLANFDDLTALPNRHMFSNHLETALLRAQREGGKVALIVLDLDDFKAVNDLFGHSAGDLLLMSFARRMLDSGIKLYRTGGDEFALIIHDCTDRDDALRLAARIHAVLEPSFELTETFVDCRTSIGCAIFPWHGDDASELLKSADIALYAAKDAGRARTKIFASAMRSDLQRRNSMFAIAKDALVADDIDAFFQPKIRLRDGQLVGFEALMRIHSERFGPQAPAIISAAFDHPEIALAIADRMSAQVITAVSEWNRSGLSIGRVAINASPLEFRGGDYAERLLSRLEAMHVAPHSLEVEITETVFIAHDDQSVLGSLGKLRAAGITVALDDFGTGYASLSHLRQYPVDVLKIDQSFVREVETDERQRLITRGVIELSRTMGIETVAEGVENQTQADILKSFGCDIGQGYFFGRPMSSADAEHVLLANLHGCRGAPHIANG